MKYLLVVVLILILVILFWPSGSNNYPIAYTAQTTNQLNNQIENMAPLSVFNNPHGFYYVSEPPRKNMSYDLRGDPLRIPKQDFIWNNSEIPEYNAVPVFTGDII